MNPNLHPLLRLGALIGGGMVCTALLGWLVFLLAGFKASEPLAHIALGLLVLIGVVLVSLAAVNFKATVAGNSVEIDGDGKP